MPRVRSQVAAKDYPSHGIKKGETYYSWKFRYGGPRKSKTYPEPSQLTNSPFLQTVYGAAEQIDEAEDADALRSIAQEVRDAGEECQSSLDNMPEGLQQGSTGELLQTRIDNCEAWADEIERVADDLEEKLGEIDDKEDEQASLRSQRDEWEALSEEEQDAADEPEEPEADWDAEEAKREALEAAREEANGADPGDWG